MAKAWAIPVGVLGAICVAMFVFIWWWFPRHYRKGVTADMDRVDEEHANRDRNRDIILAAQGARTDEQAASGDNMEVPYRKPTLEERVKAIHAARAYESTMAAGR